MALSSILYSHRCPRRSLCLTTLLSPSVGAGRAVDEHEPGKRLVAHKERPPSTRISFRGISRSALRDGWLMNRDPHQVPADWCSNAKAPMPSPGCTSTASTLRTFRRQVCRAIRSALNDAPEAAHRWTKARGVAYVGDQIVAQMDLRPCRDARRRAGSTEGGVMKAPRSAPSTVVRPKTRGSASVRLGVRCPRRSAVIDGFTAIGPKTKFPVRLDRPLPKDLKFKGEETYLEIGQAISSASRHHPPGTRVAGAKTTIGNRNRVNGLCTTRRHDATSARHDFWKYAYARRPCVVDDSRPSARGPGHQYADIGRTRSSAGFGGPKTRFSPLRQDVGKSRGIYGLNTIG